MLSLLTIIGIVNGAYGAAAVTLLSALLFLGIGILLVRSSIQTVRGAKALCSKGLVLRRVEERELEGGGMVQNILVDMAAEGVGLDKIYYYECDNGVKLKVSKAAAEILRDCDPHAVYYALAMGTATLLSIEPIPREEKQTR